MCLTGMPLTFVRVQPEQTCKYRATYIPVVLNWMKFCPQGHSEMTGDIFGCHNLFKSFVTITFGLFVSLLLNSRNSFNILDIKL